MWPRRVPVFTRRVAGGRPLDSFTFHTLTCFLGVKRCIVGNIDSCQLQRIPPLLWNQSLDAAWLIISGSRSIPGRPKGLMLSDGAEIWATGMLTEHGCPYSASTFHLSVYSPHRDEPPATRACFTHPCRHCGRSLLHLYLNYTFVFVCKLCSFSR